jgi:WhiB family redox-sensing transcriptional regulator
VTVHDATPVPRRQLLALWDALAARGAVVHRLDIDALPDDIIDALCEHEARRVRALHERPATQPEPPPQVTGAQRAALRSLIALIADVVVATQPQTDDAPTPVPGAPPQPDPGSPEAGRRATRRVPNWVDLDRLERTTPQRGWERLAACRGLDPNWFHPDHGRSQRQQKAICADCPVRYACLAYDLAAVKGADDYGIWGGTSERERKAIRTALNTRRASEKAA